MRRIGRIAICVVLVAAGLTGSTRSADAEPAQTWVDAWGASFLSTTVNGALQTAVTVNNQTLRLNVFAKLGGNKVRVKLTNAFATNTLHVGAAHAALQASGGSIKTGSDRALTFAGATSVALAAGAEVWSDPVDLVVAQHSTVAISVFVPDKFLPTTFHPTGLHTSYLSKTGNYTASTTLPAPSGGATTTTQVVIVAGLQVMAPSTSKVVVAFGDSITDGACATNNANATWPDVLSNRLPALASGAPAAVINMGIGSNRLVASDSAGPSGVHRFAADVLARPNVGWVIVLEGINDISYHQAAAATITNAYDQLIAYAHGAGIKVYGATLLPIGNSTKYTIANEATRQSVNAWIRTSGHFDAVVDFEAIVMDPSFNPTRIKSNLTCDYVHPNTAGYAALGNAIPLSLFG